MLASNLQHRVDTALRDNPHLVGHSLASETSEGHVVLRGTVGSFYQKQMAQESLRAIDEIETIANELEVHWN